MLHNKYDDGRRNEATHNFGGNQIGLLGFWTRSIILLCWILTDEKCVCANNTYPLFQFGNLQTPSLYIQTLDAGHHIMNTYSKSGHPFNSAQTHTCAEHTHESSVKFISFRLPSNEHIGNNDQVISFRLRASAHCTWKYSTKGATSVQCINLYVFFVDTTPSLLFRAHIGDVLVFALFIPVVFAGSSACMRNGNESKWSNRQCDRYAIIDFIQRRSATLPSHGSAAAIIILFIWIWVAINTRAHTHRRWCELYYSV